MGLSLYDRWKQMNWATSAPSTSDSADLVDISSTQTLTNKTLTTGTISGATFTGTYTLSGAVTLPSQTGTPYLKDVTTVAGAFKIAYGTGTLTSGTVTINTGLTINTFIATSSGAEQTTTGNKSVQSFGYTISGSSGAVVTAYYTTVATAASGTAAASTGSSGTFSWIAIGS